MKAGEITGALASFVRTIRSGDSRFDRYAAGENERAERARESGPRAVSRQGRLHRLPCRPKLHRRAIPQTGVAWRDGRLTDDGRFTISHEDRDRGAFKTPTLREISRTAPYMHDGSLATLEDVVEFYSNGGRRNPNIDVEIRTANFNAEEKRALLAFLRSLTGSIEQGWKN